MENTNVFNLISLQKWNEIIKMINKNDNFDINIRDNSSYYLINYAIMFNNSLETGTVKCVNMERTAVQKIIVKTIAKKIVSVIGKSEKLD